MFKNLINEDIFMESTYEIQDFTIGFELESWADNIHLKDEFSDFADKYWKEQADILAKTQKSDKKLINLKYMSIGYDSTISPDDGYGSSYTCDNCGGDGTIECPECNGTGNITAECPECYGSGMMECPTCRGEQTVFDTCRHCNGTGKDPDGQLDIFGEVADCPICKGEGKVEQDCPDCSTGKVICNVCGGDGFIRERCDRCDGRGRITCRDCNGEGYIDDDSDDERTYEWRSPVFALTPFNLQKIIRFLALGIDKGMINTNQSCGFHVHIGFPNQYTRSEDMFWILLQMVTRNEAEKFKEILEFKGIQFYGGTYVGKKRFENMINNLEDLSYELKDKKFFMDTEGKQIKDDLGAYDVDVEKEAYKSYKEEYLIEARRYKKQIDKRELTLWNTNSVNNFIRYFYSDDKYNIFRQHPQGTLEWRGPRRFLDRRDVGIIKEFFLRKLYPFIKWINDMLDEQTLDIGGVTLSRDTFNKILITHNPPASRIRKSTKQNYMFSDEQDMSIVGRIFKENKWIKNFDIRYAHMYYQDNNLIISNAIIKNKNSIESPFPNSVIFRISRINIKTIFSGNFDYCVVLNATIQNGSFTNGRLESVTINNGIFNDDITIQNSNVNGGFFNNCTIQHSNINNGRIIETFLANNKVDGNATFEKVLWNNGDWISGNWINGEVKFSYGNSIFSEENPNETMNLYFKTQAAEYFGKRDYTIFPDRKENENISTYITRVGLNV